MGWETQCLQLSGHGDHPVTVRTFHRIAKAATPAVRAITSLARDRQRTARSWGSGEEGVEGVLVFIPVLGW